MIQADVPDVAGKNIKVGVFFVLFWVFLTARLTNYVSAVFLPCVHKRIQYMRVHLSAVAWPRLALMTFLLPLEGGKKKKLLSTFTPHFSCFLRSSRDFMMTRAYEVLIGARISLLSGHRNSFKWTFLFGHTLTSR